MSFFLPPFNKRKKRKKERETTKKQTKANIKANTRQGVMKFSTWFTAVAALVGCCKASTLHIQSVDDFLNFTQRVNVEFETFRDTTILLETDLDMTGVEDFEPIGSAITRKEEFSGIFDGQWHHIGNLTHITTDRVSGIFGYINGATIRNLIVDDTCTFTNLFVLPENPENHTSGFIGGIVGACVASDSECRVYNCTSHAKIIYNGKNTGYGAYIGGIIGFCRGDQYDCVVKDSAYTGHITAGGEAGDKNNIVGGIAAVCVGFAVSNTSCIIDHSVNTGTILYSGISSRIMVGGIAGGCGISSYFSSCTISKCVSEGTNAFNVTAKTGTSNVGGLVGMTISGSITKDSYWSQAVSENGVGFSTGGSPMSNCKKYNGSVPLSTPWKLTKDTLAITSGELIRGLAKNDMVDKLREWIDSTYTISFVTNTYDKIGARNSGFLDNVFVNGTVPENNKDEAFGGWFVSDLFVYQLPIPCVLRKNITVYGYWTAHPEVDAAQPLYKPAQIIVSLFLIFFMHLFF